MPTPESALRATEERLDSARRQARNLFLSNDGQIDRAEQQVLNEITRCQAELARGDAAITHAVSIIRSFNIHGSPRSQRRMREVERDLSLDQDLELGAA